MGHCEEWLKVGDIAKILGISKTKAYALANSPGFPAIRLGKNIRVARSSLDTFLLSLEGKTFEI